MSITKHLFPLLVAVANLSEARAQDVQRNIPYAEPDTSAQAQRLGNVLKDAGVPVTVFGAKETSHTKINASLGLPDDPATVALFEFLRKALKK